MSAARNEIDPRERMLLERYHDGELSGLARYRFERRLRASAPLRGELVALRGMRAGLRALAAESPAPDLWGEIVGRLPAPRIASRPRAQALREAASRRRWAPAGAALAATAAGLALFALLSPEPAPRGGVVRWVDGGGRGVVVLEAAPDATIIWLLDPAQELARPGGSEHEL